MLYLLHECFKKHKNGKLMSLTKGRGVWDIALRTVKELKEHHAETGQKLTPCKPYLIDRIPEAISTRILGIK